MPNIEVEIRSFIDEPTYRRLLAFFQTNAKFIKEDFQETFYFDAPKDLRIQRGGQSAKIWMKEGKIHDEAREEIEVRFGRDDFEKMESLIVALGYPVKIKWFRDRKQFDWSGIKVCLDDTRGYGRIIELERLTSEDERDSALADLKEKLKELGVELTPREVFEHHFADYSRDWRILTSWD